MLYSLTSRAMVSYIAHEKSMTNDHKRKITIIGAGFVGSTSAFSLIAAQAANEIALVDINTALVRSQVMDLQHSIPSWGQCQVKVGTYDDIRDSDIAVITCGANQKPGETRLDLIKKNSAIIKDIGSKIFKANPNVIVIVVTNPVDLLTYQLVRMFPKKQRQLIGSGTILDTARLRYLLGQHFKINPTSVHAYIIGEHGDSEFPLWSTANIGQIPLAKYPGYDAKKMDRIFNQAKNAAYAIIKGKQATYYAIASGVTHLVKTILGDKNSVLPVSSLLTSYHGISNICLSVPSVIGRSGVKHQLRLSLNKRELSQLKKSAQTLKQAARGLVK